MEICNEIRHIAKPQWTQIHLGSRKPLLIACDKEGKLTCLPISRRVAEILIANDMAYNA